jgi:GAF domain-containing protein
MTEKPPVADKSCLDSFLNAARAIQKYTSFAEAARAIFDEACLMTGATSGYVALMTEDGAENEVLFLEAGGLPCTVDPELPMPIRGLREVCYRTRSAVFENDFMNSDWEQYMPEGHVVLRNIMFAPLNIEDKTLGVMGLANKEGSFTRDDAEIATAFGDFCAVALNNSRILDQLRETINRKEELLNKIKTLEGLLPMCSKCKKIRNDQGAWQILEEYITSRTEAKISHGLCPDCGEALYSDFLDRSGKDPKR